MKTLHVYQAGPGASGGQVINHLYECEDEDQAQDEVTRINRNLELAGVPSSVSYAYYSIEQHEFSEKQLDTLRQMVESYRSHQLDLYGNPPSVTLFSTPERELFELLGID